MKSTDMIFWGELLPKTTIGTSISNTNIINILKEEGTSIHIVEEYSWNLGTIKKIAHYLTSYFKLVKLFSSNKYKCFYLMLPPSKFGLLKSFFLLPVLKLIQPKAQFIAHVHRGDTKTFYYASAVNKFLLNSVLKYINKVIVLSPVFKQHFIDMGYKGKINVLRNTSNLEDIGKRYEVNYRGKFIAILNYLRTKGIYDLVQGFSDPTMLKFSLDTYGAIYEKDTYQGLLKIKTNNININQFLDRNSFVDTILKYDALILPSWNEGQPTIIIEAMAMGIPVIATDVGDVKNMLGDDYPFIFQPKNINHLKSTIFKFHNYENKQSISKYLRERYFKLFANANYKKEVIKIFK